MLLGSLVYTHVDRRIHGNVYNGHLLCICTLCRYTNVCMYVYIYIYISWATQAMRQMDSNLAKQRLRETG